MAELTTVEINEPTQGEIETVSETVEEQPQPEHIATDSQEEGAVEEQTEESSSLKLGQGERPEGLPDKFNSIEDLVNSYQELETKLSQGNQETTTNENGEETVEVSTSEVLTYASEEFHGNGELSKDTYETLAEFGISEDIVNSYIAGQQALTAQRTTEIKGAANGEYEQMGEWAVQNLPPDELEAYNNVVEGLDINAAKMAVSGLYARYKSGTSQPNLTMGNTSGAGVTPFADMQAVRAAMSDPRYKSGDKAYHAEVDRRLKVSNF